MHVYPYIASLSGLRVTPSEAALFRAFPPAGFILFRRNVDTPTQVKDLCATLYNHSPIRPLPILIDQEGGRVQRLNRPYWPAYPAMGTLEAPQAVYDANVLIATGLREVGITVNCTPVCDLRLNNAHFIIGDRAFGSTPDAVIENAGAVIRAHNDVGIVSILKHIPGHGRATEDSHLALPVVHTGLDVLMETDFAPFKALNAPWAMTAHIVYTAIDAAQPATWSRRVIERIIRGHIGFKGILISDDVGMKALTGTYRDRAAKAMAAGCDLALHCSGELEEMQDMVQGLLPMGTAALARLQESMVLGHNKGRAYA
ncbi:MAG: beta-N-acetylhexosaminidase [Holosporales bacterium]|jgi:beta-N-acetylhexosaminidase|nr:beta-N-acetylhexosaminidase [Thalassospira sp.]